MWSAKVIEIDDPQRPYGIEVKDQLVATVRSWEIAQWLSTNDQFIDMAFVAIQEEAAPVTPQPGF